MRLLPGLISLVLLSATLLSFGQIDPEKRQLLQLGYDQPLRGRGPIAGYAFYYYNHPQFYRTNLTLRLALAPVYFDSELGFSDALGKNTDFAIGMTGGAFADDYSEVRQGNYFRRESFEGAGGGASASIYHLFNPNHRIPLNAVLRGGLYYSTYNGIDETAKSFELPDNRVTSSLRTGVRWGGKEPILFPALALELSAWYEGQLRTGSSEYGFNNDRDVESVTHLFYAHAYLAYTLPKSRHNFSLSLTAGTSVDPDRFSAYRLGGVLPLVAEFPLIIPGYYFKEISADHFALFATRYLLPLGSAKRWHLTVVAATAVVDYLSGLEQPGHWHSGVGGGITYKSQSEVWKIALGYGYGFDAIREGTEGAHNVSFLLQFDVERLLHKRKGMPPPPG